MTPLHTIVTDYDAFGRHFDVYGLISQREFERKGPRYWAEAIADDPCNVLTDADRDYLQTLRSSDRRAR